MASPVKFASISNATNRPNPISNTLALRSSDMAWSPIGCWADSQYHHTLDYEIENDDSLTVDKCQTSCMKDDYVYAGVEYGSKCWCGNELKATTYQVADSYCNLSCAGDNQGGCGGDFAMEIYAYDLTTSITAVFPTATHTKPTSVFVMTTYITTPPTISAIATPGAYLSLACYSDSISNRTLGNRRDVTGGQQGMTTELCQAACWVGNYLLAGVEFGHECWCDNHNTNQIDLFAVPDSECNMSCSGNASEICGGNNRINIYRFIAATDTSSALSYTSPTPTSMITMSTSSHATTTTSTSTVSTTNYATTTIFATATLTSTRPDSTSICLMYYRVLKGDYCYNIWTHFRISQDQFKSYNPSLTSPDCLIQPGQVLCVEQGPAANATIRTVTALATDLPTSVENVATSTTPAMKWPNTTTLLTTLAVTSTRTSTTSISMSTSTSLSRTALSVSPTATLTSITRVITTVIIQTTLITQPTPVTTPQTSSTATYMFPSCDVVEGTCGAS